MVFSRGKVQILYNHLPGALFAHDEYGHCKISAVEMSELADVNKAAISDLLSDTLAQWPNDWQKAGFPPSGSIADLSRNFVIGEPIAVRFSGQSSGW